MFVRQDPNAASDTEHIEEAFKLIALFSNATKCLCHFMSPYLEPAGPVPAAGGDRLHRWNRGGTQWGGSRRPAWAVFEGPSETREEPQGGGEEAAYAGCQPRGRSKSPAPGRQIRAVRSCIGGRDRDSIWKRQYNGYGGPIRRSVAARS